MGRLLKISILPCVLLVIVAGVFLRSGGARATSPQTCASWSTVFSPNPSINANSLRGVAAISASDVWAVGSYASSSTSTDQTLIEQWNGKSWNVIPSPNTGHADFLNGIAASSATNVWAVGFYQDSSSYDRTLIEQWNGTSWSIVPSPSPGGFGSVLYGVTAISASDAWAVGYYNDGIGKTLIEHWNGTSWSVVSSPNPSGVNTSELKAIAHVKGTNQLWAVGDYQTGVGAPYQTLIERWNGTSWSIISSPSPGSFYNTLGGVTAVSASDVWAVGDDAGSHAGQTLIEQWNGSSWSVVSSPNVGSGSNYLYAVTALSGNDVWAVGMYLNSSSIWQTLSEQWNGSNWHVVPSANKGTHSNGLAGVSSISGTGVVWAVGSYNRDPHTLVEFYC